MEDWTGKAKRSSGLAARDIFLTLEGKRGYDMDALVPNVLEKLRGPFLLLLP